MGKYDAIRGAGNVTVKAPPDFWTSFKQQYDDDYDRLVAAQTRKKEEYRYTKESTEEQNRYDTEQENLMFEKKHAYAENEYTQAMAEYKLAYEQIGQHNPEMLSRLQTQFGKEYKIPRQDGTFEIRYVVPQSVREFTTGKVQSKKDLDDILDRWLEFTPALKASLWPQVKKINRYFDRDLTDIEASAKRAMSYEDNAKLLDTMGAFLPAGYDATKWEDATKILLKDGEVSEAELKLVAADINANITNRKAAEKFWSEFSSNVMKARGALKLDSDPTVIRDLQTMQEAALSNLDKYYPGVSESTDRGKFGAEAERFSQDIYKKSFDELNLEEKKDVTNKASTVVFQGAGFTTQEDEEEKEVPLEEEAKPSWVHPKGKSLKNPVTLDYGWSPENLAKAVKDSPFTYANKGLIPSDEWPGFKEVSIKEALQHYQKNKSKYKKDKPITISTKGIWPFFQGRPDKDLTQYPE